MQCSNCGHEGDEKYCGQCGQPLRVERIRLPQLLHDLVHTFTHFEKGFLFTLKQLVLHPGKMQRSYLAGARSAHQKPFPFFVICGTVCALVLFRLYQPERNNEQEEFFKHYYVFVQTAMLPVYALVAWLFFFRSKFYYAEILVMNVYMVGMMMLFVIPINLFHNYLSNGVISLLEIILLALYNVWTYIQFFPGRHPWLTAIRSVINIFISYLLFQEVSNLVIGWLVR